MTTWRDRLSPIIAEVIDRVGVDDMKELRRELRAAFPCRPFRFWPYRVWLNEIRRQLDPRYRGPRRRKLTRDHPNQRMLWSDA